MKTIFDELKQEVKNWKTRIDFKTGNEEDKYEYSLTDVTYTCTVIR